MKINPINPHLTTKSRKQANINPEDYILRDIEYALALSENNERAISDPVKVKIKGVVKKMEAERMRAQFISQQTEDKYLSWLEGETPPRTAPVRIPPAHINNPRINIKI